MIKLKITSSLFVVVLLTSVCAFAQDDETTEEAAPKAPVASFNFEADVIEGDKTPFQEDIIEGTRRQSALFVGDLKDDTSIEAIVYRRTNFNDFIEAEKVRGHLKPQ